MRLTLLHALALLLFSGMIVAQQDSGQNQPPSKADQEKSRDRSAETGESSSRDTRIDISPPKDDVKTHPNSATAPTPLSPDNPEDMTNMTGDVQEMHPWNPYRAGKDDEVAEYYFKTGNYKGALARYQDALIYKDNDAIANFGIAQCYEKMGQHEEAVPYYQAYLKILPDGPLSKHAKKALKRLGAPEKSVTENTTSK
jgi:tetratricopeptide (TPR) repeat protein